MVCSLISTQVAKLKYWAYWAWAWDSPAAPWDLYSKCLYMRISNESHRHVTNNIIAQQYIHNGMFGCQHNITLNLSSSINKSGWIIRIISCKILIVSRASIRHILYLEMYGYWYKPQNGAKLHYFFPFLESCDLSFYLWIRFAQKKIAIYLSCSFTS